MAKSKIRSASRQDPQATANLKPEGQQAYRIKYRAAAESVLRVPIPLVETGAALSGAGVLLPGGPGALAWGTHG